MKSIISFQNFESKMKRFAMRFIFLLTLMILNVFGVSRTQANNLSISNVTYNQGAGTVTFDLSWKNSWRKSTWTAKNWDAAWVFVKWRDCNDAATVQFTHGLVSETVGDHNFNVNSGSTTFEPTKKDGTVGIDASPNNTGVMLRNNTDGSTGDVSATITLKLTNLPATGSLDFRAYGIEMVFVPQNTFVLGDGDGYQASNISFTSSPSPTAPNIINSAITSENSQAVYELTTTGICPSSGTCGLTAAFPKGYAAFYIMKYETSQGQYADFLNAINSAGQSAHYPNTNLNRMTIVNNITPPTQYSAERPDRACNYLSWINVSAYLDWAALRPLTELEFEKACRGTETSIPFQKAWGTTTGTPPVAGDISGAENGTETINTSGVNVNINSIQWTSGDGNFITGPLRCGIFATGSTTSRLQTGMSFYGAMELSGNVIEYYVSALSGIVGSPSASGVALGNGTLNGITGSHDNSNWPTALTPGNNIIRRGGDWSTTSGHTAAASIATNISYRASGTSGTADSTTGGRGGR